MNGKWLITSFFLANTLDSTASSILLTQEGWQELNYFAVTKMSEGQLHDFLILKFAFTAVLIGTYAIACQINSRLAFPLEKTLQLGSLLVWAVQLWNGANLLAAVLPGLG